MKRGAAFGEIRADEVKLRDAQGRKWDAEQPTLVFLSRLDCDIRCIEVPPVTAREMQPLVRNRVRALYPGDLQNVAIDHVEQRSGTRTIAVVAIMPSDLFARYRQAVPKARLTTMAHAARAFLPARFHGMLVHWTSTYAEVLKYEQGLLLESTLLTRSGSGSDLAKLRRLIGEPAAGTAIRVLALKSEIAWIEKELAKSPGDLSLELTPIEETSFSDKAAPLFRPERESPRLPLTLVRAVLIALVPLLALAVFFKYVAYKERELAAYRTIVFGSEQSGALVTKLTVQHQELQKQLDGLQKKRPIDVYQFFSDLRSVLGPSIYVREIVLQSGTFQFQALGPNALEVMERFSANARFKDVRLLQTTPLPGTPREQFTVSGKYIDEQGT